jgi:hypothetical protein
LISIKEHLKMKKISTLIVLSFISSPVFANDEEVAIDVSASAICPTSVTYGGKTWIGEDHTIHTNPEGNRVSCHYINSAEPESKVVGVIETKDIIDSMTSTKWILRSATSEVAKTSAKVNARLSKIEKP